MPDNAPDPSNQSPNNDPTVPVNPDAPVPGKNLRPRKPVNKRRRWLIAIGVLLLGLLVLVVFAPKIASTSAVRGIIVGQINDRINGKVTIDDWGLSWFGGIHVTGVNVADEQDRRILHLGALRTQLTLLDAIRGHYALGETEIDEPDLTNIVYEKDGSSNLDHLMKRAPSGGGEGGHAGKTSAGEAAPPPDVSGHIVVKDFMGTITANFGDLKKVVYLSRSDSEFRITDLNSPMDMATTIKYRFATADAPSRISSTGSAQLYTNNKSELTKFVNHLELENVHPDPIAEIISAISGQHLVLSGTVNGALDFDVPTPDKPKINGQVTVDKAQLGGDILKGDVYATDKATFTAQMLASQDSTGTHVQIAKLSAETTDGSVSVTGDTTFEALQNLANKHAPGSKGSLQLVAAISHLEAANMLRHALSLAEGTTLNKGTILANVNLTTDSDHASIDTKVDIADVAGTRLETQQGMPSVSHVVTLKPVSLAFSGTEFPNGKDIPDLRDLAMKFTSSFATLTGGGKTLGSLNANGSVNLAASHDDLSQFVAMPEMSGTVQFGITTTGDVSDPVAPLTLAAKLTGDHPHFPLTLKIANVTKTYSVDQQLVKVNVDAVYARAKAELQGVTLVLSSGDAQSPAIAVSALAPTVSLNDLNAPIAYQLQQCQIDLPKLQAGLPAVGELLHDLAGIAVSTGVMNVGGSGSYQSSQFIFDVSKPLVVNFKNFTASKPGAAAPFLNNGSYTLTVAGTMGLGATTSADLSTLSFADDTDANRFSLQSQKNLKFSFTPAGEAGGATTISATGTLAINTNLPWAKSLADAFAGNAAASAPQVGDLRDGQLTGTLALVSGDNQTMGVTGDLNLTKLSIITSDASKPIAGESVKLHLAASADDAFKVIKISQANVTSAFANVTVSDADVLLATADGKPTDVWDKLQQAVVHVSIGDVPKLLALVDAFSPTPIGVHAAAPAPTTTIARTHRGHTIVVAETPAMESSTTQPTLNITSGSVEADLNVHRDGGKTTVESKQIAINNLAFQRGSFPAFKSDRPIKLNFAAAIDASAAAPTTTATTQPSLLAQIKQIDVTDLGGDLPVGTLAMGSPIHITDLSGNPQASGAVKLNGKLEALTQLLQSLTGNSYPYTGGYALNESIDNTGGAMHPSGNVTFTDLTATGADGQNFSEHQLSLDNDLLIDSTQHLIHINKFILDAQSSKALHVDLAGEIKNWNTTCDISSPIKLTLGYDLTKLLELIKPMLTKEQKAQLADLAATGQFTEAFTLTGSFPMRHNADDAATIPFNEAIKSLVANGAIEAATIDYQGLNISKLKLPISLKNGVATIADAGAATTQPAATAQCNGGTLNLGNASLDLSDAHPRLNIPNDQKLAAKINLNTALAAALGKYIVAFSDPSQASGVLDLTVNNCTRLPMDDYLNDPDDDGQAQFTLNIANVSVSSNTLSGVLKAIPGVSDLGTFNGNIKAAIIVVEKGDVKHTMNLALVYNNQKFPTDFNGDLRLKDLYYNSLIVTLPPSLTRTKNPIPVTFSGKLPKLSISKDFAKQLLESQLLGGLGGGSGKNGGGDSSTQPSGSSPDDLLNDVLGGLGKKKPKGSNSGGGSSGGGN